MCEIKSVTVALTYDDDQRLVGAHLATLHAVLLTKAVESI